jgi:hypothetical protein
MCLLKASRDVQMLFAAVAQREGLSLEVLHYIKGAKVTDLLCEYTETNSNHNRATVDFFS